MDSFLYCWTDHRNLMLYVGIHKGSHNDGYVCSSKTMLHEYHNRKQDFTRQILAYGTYEEMCIFETAILKSAKASSNKQFYNRHTNNGKFVNRKCLPQTAEKISKSNLGKPKFKCRGPRPNFKGEKNHFYGKTHSEEVRKIMSEKAKIRSKGASNNNARPIVIKGKKYLTMNEAASSLNTSMYCIRKMLQSGEARRVS